MDPQPPQRDGHAAARVGVRRRPGGDGPAEAGLAAMGTVSLTALGLLQLRPRRGRVGAHPGRSACCSSSAGAPPCSSSGCSCASARAPRSSRGAPPSRSWRCPACSTRSSRSPARSSPSPRCCPPPTRSAPPATCSPATRIPWADLGWATLGGLRAGRPVDALRPAHAPGLPGSRLRHALLVAGDPPLAGRGGRSFGGGTLSTRHLADGSAGGRRVAGRARRRAGRRPRGRRPAFALTRGSDDPEVDAAGPTSTTTTPRPPHRPRPPRRHRSARARWPSRVTS